MEGNASQTRKWWKEAVVYQIYPASFYDGNGDGLGDICGITAKLDYLKQLGVDVIWLSPIYQSPQADMGYDISDYRAIYPPYGTLDEVDNLIAELHKRDMKLIMDLVVNHTSSQHPWFLESRSSTSNSKRDWYIWKKPLYDGSEKRRPPNNWAQLLVDSNSAWTYDEHTSEYYLSVFTPDQPDLNWENEEVRAAVRDILIFWLNRGISGFRMDVINLISKHQSFPNAEEVVQTCPYQPAMQYYAHGPRLHEYLQELKDIVLSKYDIMTVGEMPFVLDEQKILNIVQTDGYLNMVFLFEMVEIDILPGHFRLSIHPWTVEDLKRIVNKWQRLMIDNGGWNSLYCENHDQPRSVSRFCDDSDEYREFGSKLLCLLDSTLCGTIYIYQGEELGMRNVPTSWNVDEYKDVESTSYWQSVNRMYPQDEAKIAEARTVLQKRARDNARTPIQWTAAANAGFCPEAVRPWMRVNDDYRTINAEAQLETRETPSVFQFWQRLLRLRKKHVDIFIYGDFRLVDDQNPDVFAYIRIAGKRRWITVLNFTGREVDWTMPEAVAVREWVVGNYHSTYSTVARDGTVHLKPWEGLLGECT